MPEAEQFLNGFNVKKGMKIGGYTLMSVVAIEQSVVRWNRYSYNITLTFSWNGGRRQSFNDMDKLFRDFYEYVKGERIIRTNSGRPYLCDFGEYPLEYNHTENEVIIKYLGNAVRVKESLAANYI